MSTLSLQGSLMDARSIYAAMSLFMQRARTRPLRRRQRSHRQLIVYALPVCVCAEGEDEAAKEEAEEYEEEGVVLDVKPDADRKGSVASRRESLGQTMQRRWVV